MFGCPCVAIATPGGTLALHASNDFGQQPRPAAFPTHGAIWCYEL